MVNRKKTKPELAADLLEAQSLLEERASAEHRWRLQADRQKAKAQAAEHQRKLMQRDLEETRIALDAAIGAKDWTPLKVKPRERKSRIHEATAVLLYSDLHPDETVTPGTVSGLNEFNAEIAAYRNSKLARAVGWNLEMLRDKAGLAGYKVRDFILAMLGDIISNTIHPELMESNSMMPAEAIIFVKQLAAEIIDSLLLDEELERIYIPCCHGNHDRMTVKIRHQTKAGNSLAWILYHQLADHYADEPRVVFDIARGNMLYTEVYGRTIRWTHGDDVKYYGGVGGLTIPMRKAIDAWNQSHNAWLTCCGHWHNVIDERDFVVNGSLIGYTAYAQAIKARYQPAAQVMFLIDKDYGKGWVKPIVLQDKGHW